MYKLFFDKKQEQKRWVVVYNLLIPSIFAILGTYFAVKSYYLSIDMKNNREQIDSLTVMIGEIRQQNNLLQKSVAILEKQLEISLNERKHSISPKLFVEDLVRGEVAEVSSLWVRISNLGGNLFDMTYLLNGIQIDKTEFPKNGQMGSGSHFDIQLMNMKKTICTMRFLFKDELGNKYIQDLVCSKNNESDYVFYFAALQDSK